MTGTAITAEEKLETFKSLQSVIKAEIDLYQKYIPLMEEERRAVVASDAEKLEALTAERNLLVEQIRHSQLARRQILRNWSADRLLKLTVFVETFFEPREAKLMMPLVMKLKELATAAQSTTSECSQVVKFSLGMVSGLVSILWSATQNVVRSYSPIGKLRESYHPSTGRAAGVLRSV